MRRTADLHPGGAETDAKDSAVIADAVRTMPHTLRSLELTAESIVLVGFDQGLAAESTHTVSWDRAPLAVTRSTERPGASPKTAEPIRGTGRASRPTPAFPLPLLRIFGPDGVPRSSGPSPFPLP
ncbi:hypothetical protein FM21_23155 [Streptomyces mutabilis]|uniref:Transposase IS110-like N-terminal domain-containing protein n=1 Tax=Streptomyces mutabilis TaxID=67332 RepID=A0A086MXS6_9ACTN|nr:hypothetical protein FM21_23155 [Streptomyces mutabilis]